MPKSCCVPGCKSNYYDGDDYVSCFSFPADEKLRNQWILKIPRKDLRITGNTRVCIKHFPESKILREIRATRLDGTELVIPRKRLALADDAIPCIFPNLPDYLTVNPPSVRRDPEERRGEHHDRVEQMYSHWLAEDKIPNLDDVINNSGRFSQGKWLLHKENNILYILSLEFTDIPSLRKVVIMRDDFKLEIIVDGVKLNMKGFEWILGKEHTCDLYSKLENILVALNNIEEKTITNEDRICAVQGLVAKCVENCTEVERNFFKFTSEQLQLQVSKQVRYSVEMLLLACNLFFTFPAAYKFLRDQKIMIMPHPTYLKTFCLSKVGTGISTPLKIYLQKKCQVLEPHERKVSLLLDEIYVKPKITYKGNRVVGMASNTSQFEVATTVQVFMVKSILSKSKDVVALLPVTHLNADFLHQITLQVLTTLHEVGYEVISIISDNNKVNVKLFRLLSNDTSVHTCIPNPCDHQKKIFLLYDSVHVLKNLRNNLLNECNKTFIYPSMSSSSDIKMCKFQHIRQIYKHEKSSLVKHAPRLSYKVCYPNSLERQNVSYVVSIFHETTIAAMGSLAGILDSDSQGTQEWLTIIQKWWTIVNVKHPMKGIHLRETFANPIRRVDQESVQFLMAFCDWLRKWNDVVILDAPKSVGKLSRETFDAILHTTETLVQLCEYLLSRMNFCYVLLGSFQTDDLEERFGLYRRMSGCNYNISVQQIIESERKLKVTSLLKLRAHGAKINVADIISQVNSVCESESIDLVLCDESYKIEAACAEVDVDTETLESLIFIAGYVGYKVSSKCEKCKHLLITGTCLSVELPREMQYLNNLDRGGLKYPTEFSVNVGVNCYKAFLVLTSENYEMMFINHDSPKGLMKAVLTDVFELDYVSFQCECGMSMFDVFDKCVNIWVNVFLNNYSKLKTNRHIEKIAQKSTKRVGTFSCKRPRKAEVLQMI